MLVSIVELIQIPEIPPVVLRGCAVAGLKPIYNTICTGRNACEFAALRLLVLARVVEDRELVVVTGGVTRRYDQLPDEMVEGTAVVVQDLPDLQIELAWHWGNTSEAEVKASSSRVDLLDNTVLVGVTKDCQVPGQRLA